MYNSNLNFDEIRNHFNEKFIAGKLIGTFRMPGINSWRTFAIELYGEKTRGTYYTSYSCILNTASLWGVRNEKWTAHDDSPTVADFFASLIATALIRGDD